MDRGTLGIRTLAVWLVLTALASACDSSHLPAQDAGVSMGDAAAADADARHPVLLDAGHTPAPAYDAGDPVTEDDAGDETIVSGFLTYNVKPITGCEYPIDATVYFGSGQYDVARSGDAASPCAGSYVAHYIAYAPLSASSGLLHSATIRLLNPAGVQIAFGGSLPNPFTVTTSGMLQPQTDIEAAGAVVALELIPAAYAAQLKGSSLVGQTILAQILLAGVAPDGGALEFRPQDYAIELCEGCLTHCESEIRGQSKTDADFVDDQCVDNSGQDGRVCIDQGC